MCAFCYGARASVWRAITRANRNRATAAPNPYQRGINPLRKVAARPQPEPKEPAKKEPVR